MKCKNLKIESKKGVKKGHCKLYNKDVSVFCNECPFEIKYDIEKLKKKSKQYKPIKKRSSKLAKAEKGRFSIIYQDLTKCAICGRLATEINEVFDGAYRQLSIKYGCCMPMCHECHTRFHHNREVALYYKRLFQDKFIESHSLEEFLDIFKMDYHYRA